ncbi:MAG: AsmA family protein [Bryobacterales bacterium]|nr:AsmA family protein [Bryobacteraceae bacterium]MDW8131339.1 AsmA family protein [Bryobacterales bacterium]
MKNRVLRRSLAAVAACGLIAVAAAPYWNLERYRRQIQAGLERELHRRVTAGKVRLELLGGPGVSLSDVVIEDDPRAGREPFAYVSSLEARIALRSLWTGQLEFASLRLVEPSVNLVKPASGSWNFLDLASRPPGIPAREAGRMPPISVRKARINFKFGDTKSVFYLANADVDLEPPTGRQRSWEVRFSGEPARADRPAQGLGRLAGRGRLEPGGPLELEVTVERTYLEEISALLTGRDLGLRGQLTSRAKLHGPVSALRIAGEAELRDFRRWELLPPLGSDWRLTYAGMADLPGQRVRLEAFPAAGVPLKLRWEAERYLSDPDWNIEVALEAMPASAFLDLLRVLGARVPASLELGGAVSGAVSYAPRVGWQGALEGRELAARAATGVQLRCPAASILIEGERVRLGPWRLETQGGGRLNVEGVWSAKTDEWALHMGAERAPAAVGAPSWAGLPDIPVLAACDRGFWSGSLRLMPRGGQPGRWIGRIELRDAEMPVVGLASPIALDRAELRLAPDEIRLTAARGRVGDLTFDVSYAAREAVPRPAQLDVRLERLDLAELERLLAPVLDRRRGVLARALRWQRALAPGWLLRRRLEGRFEAASLDIGEWKLAGALKGNLSWDGLKVTLRELSWTVGDGELRGRAEIDLRRATPAYSLTLAGGPFEAGGARWWVEGWLESEGVGEDLGANLRAAGVVVGRGIPIAPDEQLEWLAARFTLRQLRRGSRLSVEAVEAVQRDAVYRGEARTDLDGRLVAELTGEHRRLRLEGTLWPLKLARAPAP